MNNDVLAANLHHYILTLLDKKITSQYSMKTVKWRARRQQSAKMLKLPANAFLLLQTTNSTIYETMRNNSHPNPSIYYCIGHLPNNRTEVNPHPNPYWDIPGWKGYNVETAEMKMGHMIIGNLHQYQEAQPSPKYIGFDITHIFGEIDGPHDRNTEQEKLFNLLRAVADGTVQHDEHGSLTSFLENHYKHIVTTLGSKYEDKAKDKGRLSWPEYYRRFGGVFDENVPRHVFDSPHDYDTDTFGFSYSYHTKVDKFFLKN